MCGNVIDDIGNAIGSAANAVADGVAGVVTGVGGAVVGIAQGAGDVVGGVVQGVGDVVEGIAHGNVSQGFEQAGNDIVNGVKAAGSDIANDFNQGTNDANAFFNQGLTELGIPHYDPGGQFTANVPYAPSSPGSGGSSDAVLGDGAGLHGGQVESGIASTHLASGLLSDNGTHSILISGVGADGGNGGSPNLHAVEQVSLQHSLPPLPHDPAPVETLHTDNFAIPALDHLHH
jgi:hypothetical protein